MRLAPLFASLLVLSGMGTALGAVAVQVAGDRLTVRAEDTSLQDILQAVAAAGHFPLQLDTSLTDPITVEIAQRPLLEVLVWLLREQSMLIRYTRDGDGVRVEEVRVLAASPPVGRKSAAGPGGMAESSEPPLSQEQILVELTASPDVAPAERIGAALALAGTDQADRGGGVIVDLLRTHDDPDVRQQALAALAGLATVPLEAVVSAAVNDPEPSVRGLALALLSEMAPANPEAKAIIEQAAVLEPDADLQQMARALVESSQGGNP